MVENINTILADGPSAMPFQPSKAALRAWGTRVEEIIAAFFSTGGKIYQTRALLNADLVPAANSIAWVMEDTTVANNGIYRKVGGTGTGSWVRAGDLPFSFIVASNPGAGTANAIQATTSIPVSSSALVILPVAAANTASPVTVSFNGGTALTVKTNSGNDPVVGGFVSGMLLMGFVSGSTFRLVSDQASAAILALAEDAANRAEAAAAGVSLPPVAANRMLVDNPAGTARESKGFSDVRALLHPLRGFNADGATSDSANFTTLEASYSGNVIDLQGKTYLVSAVPTGNTYLNGFWKLSGGAYNGKTYPADQSAGTAYDGGPYQSPSPGTYIPGPDEARITKSLAFDAAIQGGLTRGFRVGQLWSYGTEIWGNCTGAIASRLNKILRPQSVGVGCEELEVTGFSGVGAAALYTSLEGLKVFAAATNRVTVSSREAAAIAANNCVVGDGAGLRLDLVVNSGDGGIDAINIGTAGLIQTSAYKTSPVGEVIGRIGGTGCTFTVNLTGTTPTSVTVNTRGSGYSTIPGENFAYVYTAGRNSAIVGGVACTTRKDRAVIVGSNAFNGEGISCFAGGVDTGYTLSDLSFALGGSGVYLSAAAVRSGVMASRNVELITPRAVAMGDSVTAVTPNGASNKNNTIRFESGTGTGRFLGGTVTTGLDYAEMMENAIRGVIEDGTVLARCDGGKVCVSQAGDGLPIAGVVSVNHATLGNDPMDWPNKHLRNKFGRAMKQDVQTVSWPAKFDSPHVLLDAHGEPYIEDGQLIRAAYDGLVSEVQDTIPDDAEYKMESVPVVNPAFNIDEDYVLRSERPEEWTRVGFLGQLAVRVAEPFGENDYIGSGGLVSPERTCIVVMRVDEAYSEENGYGVAWCYVNVLA